MDNKFLLGIILAIASIAGYVALAMSGDEKLEAARGVFLFTTPFIAILIGSSAVDKLTQKTDEIQKQTNGHLTQRIEDVAEAAANRAIEKRESK